MTFTSGIQSFALQSLSELYGHEFSEKDFQINETKPEFEGDYTIVLFSLVKSLKKSPLIPVDWGVAPLANICQAIILLQI